MNAQSLVEVSITWLAANSFAVIGSVLILLLGWLLAFRLSRWVNRRAGSRGGKDRTLVPLIGEITRYVVLVLAFMLAMAQLGVQTTTILAIIGGVALAIAFGLRGILANIAAGLMIVFIRPMSIGDQIEMAEVAGTVSEIGLFGTRLINSEGVSVFVPNANFWGVPITNYSREKQRRFDLRLYVATYVETEKVRDALHAVAASNQHVLDSPKPVVLVESMSGSGATMLLRVWLPTASYWDARFQLTESAREELIASDIELRRDLLGAHQLAGFEGR